MHENLANDAGKTSTFYRDGELVNAGSLDHGDWSGLQTTETNFVGKCGCSSGGFFKGTIGDFVIYDKALNLAEVNDVLFYPSVAPTASPSSSPIGRSFATTISPM